ncbi:hypothetical protein Mboo_0743 [Methanoregula boonei 6A8]|uniref:Uncharacterized protein n=1 Tax=Methanoregula boonei (strain DSM 21154 / JCM 14090 / 6A8) TaxID=456442 RepID=A7I6A0_METB6|nr:hypothetical protein Mboo_0743 [Methanoregula boonei 6A8]
MLMACFFFIFDQPIRSFFGKTGGSLRPDTSPHHTKGHHRQIRIFFQRKNRSRRPPKRDPLFSCGKPKITAENPQEDQFILPISGLEKKAANLHGHFSI